MVIKSVKQIYNLEFIAYLNVAQFCHISLKNAQQQGRSRELFWLSSRALSSHPPPKKKKKKSHKKKREHTVSTLALQNFWKFGTFS